MLPLPTAYTAQPSTSMHLTSDASKTVSPPRPAPRFIHMPVAHIDQELTKSHFGPVDNALCVMSDPDQPHVARNAIQLPQGRRCCQHCHITSTLKQQGVALSQADTLLTDEKGVLSEPFGQYLVDNYYNMNEARRIYATRCPLLSCTWNGCDEGACHAARVGVSPVGNFKYAINLYTLNQHIDTAHGDWEPRLPRLVPLSQTPANREVASAADTASVSTSSRTTSPVKEGLTAETMRTLVRNNLGLGEEVSSEKVDQIISKLETLSPGESIQFMAIQQFKSLMDQHILDISLFYQGLSEATAPDPQDSILSLSWPHHHMLPGFRHPFGPGPMHYDNSPEQQARDQAGGVRSDWPGYPMTAAPQPAPFSLPPNPTLMTNRDAVSSRDALNYYSLGGFDAAKQPPFSQDYNLDEKQQWEFMCQQKFGCNLRDLNVEEKGEQREFFKAFIRAVRTHEPSC